MVEYKKVQIEFTRYGKLCLCMYDTENKCRQEVTKINVLKWFTDLMMTTIKQNIYRVITQTQLGIKRCWYQRDVQKHPKRLNYTQYPRRKRC